MGGAPRFALVRPPVDVLHKFSKPVECLAVGYLAAALRQDGRDVVQLDGMLHDWSPARTAREILDAGPEVVGFTTVLNHLPATVPLIAGLLREAGYAGRIVVGGHAVSFFPERILAEVPEVDAVVSGEGEQTVRLLAGAVAAGEALHQVPGVTARDGDRIVRRPPRRVPDLDRLALPARDGVPELIARDGLVAMSTSRGCYARCTFCSVPRFYGLDQDRPLAAGGWHARSVASVVAEVEALHARFGLRELLIVDDEFFGGSDIGWERARALGSALAERALPTGFALSCRAENVDESALARLQEGGLRHVFVGLETGDAQALRLYGKGHTVEQNRRAVATIKGLGLSFQAGYMLFNHRSTIDEIRANVDFLRDIGELKPVVLNSSVDPHFGTPMAVLMRRDGVLEDDGLAMRARHLDERVAIARDGAAQCAAACVPYINLIASLSSSVTYEWRRELPHRRPQERSLLAALETQVNAGFCGVFEELVDALAGADPPSAAEARELVVRRLAAVTPRLDMAAGIVLNQIKAVEGEVRYWAQEDLINARLPAYAA